MAQKINSLIWRSHDFSFGRAETLFANTREGLLEIRMKAANFQSRRISEIIFDLVETYESFSYTRESGYEG